MILKEKLEMGPDSVQCGPNILFTIICWVVSEVT